MAEGEKKDFVESEKGLRSLPGAAGNGKRVKDFGSQSALAMELPFTLVGAVVLGGLLGYLLDKWLHTGPWLMMALGAAGFFAGVREVIRRLPAK